ncbi:energy transducer TonB [Arcicella rosea]|uniref:TonB family protein n=1 Tax=Arcicella rosea TaxID=502909 RepID=A0A841ESP4_9BACT|nr:energy transducer TonB [Arcicella rosea]MBB6002461.1 TonB family protein [Arcicella rosea]
MKKILNIFVLILFFFTSFAQNLSEEIDPIQKFIEATVQIPFLAQVADVQGDVTVRISMGEDNVPVRYEIVKSLRSDCDEEALRVAKLINVKNLQERLNGKKRIAISIPFFTPEKILYDNGEVFMLFDKDKKSINDDSNTKYMARYEVDSLNGFIKNGITYYILEDKKARYLDFASLILDSFERAKLSICEKKTDDVKIYQKTAFNNHNFPVFTNSFYSNGQLENRVTADKDYFFYPNGRIQKVIEKDTSKEKDSNITFTKEFNWHANGQLFYVKTRSFSKDKELKEEKYISVWDTLGNQLVKDGSGLCTLFSDKLENAIQETGLINDGLKEGKWVGKTLENRTEFIEQYKKGKLIQGIAYTESDSVAYKNTEEMAEFKGGFNAYASFLQGNLHYPRDAQMKNVEGKVYVQFTVCTDGTLCDYKILKSVGYGCDEEALRVVKKSSGKWIPGKQRGKNARSRFTLPISYKLTGSR